MAKKISDLTPATALGDNDSFVFNDVVAGNDKRVTAAGLRGNADVAKIESINELKSFEGKRDGQIIELLGYYQRGDGGEGILIWDSSSTAMDNGGSVIKVTGVTTGRWVRYEKEGFRIEQFGGIGDWNGTTGTDNANFLQNAVNTGKRVKFRAGGKYYLGSNVSSSNNNINFYCEGRCEIVSDYTAGYLFSFTTTPVKETTVSSTPLIGDDFVTLTDVTGLQSGQLIKLLSNKLWRHDPRAANYKGELTKIDKIETSNVFLTEKINDNYNEANEVIKAFIYDNYTLKFEGITFSHTGKVKNANNQNLIFTSFLSDLDIKRCQFNNWMTRSSRIAGCYTPKFRDCEFYNSDHDSLGYGVNYQGCTNGIAYNCSFSKMRTPVDFGGHGNTGTADTPTANSTGPSRFCTMESNKVNNCNKGGATHGPADRCSFISNEINNCLGIGLQSRGESIKFIGNRFNNIGNILFDIRTGANTYFDANYYDFKNSTLIPSLITRFRETDYDVDSETVMVNNVLCYANYGIELGANGASNLFVKNNIIVAKTPSVADSAFLRATSTDSPTVFDSVLKGNNFIPEEAGVEIVRYLSNVTLDRKTVDNDFYKNLEETFLQSHSLSDGQEIRVTCEQPEATRIGVLLKVDFVGSATNSNSSANHVALSAFVHISLRSDTGFAIATKDILLLNGIAETDLTISRDGTTNRFFISIKHPTTTTVSFARCETRIKAVSASPHFSFIDSTVQNF